MLYTARRRCCTQPEGDGSNSDLLFLERLRHLYSRRGPLVGVGALNEVAESPKAITRLENGGVDEDGELNVTLEPLVRPCTNLRRLRPNVRTYKQT